MFFFLLRNMLWCLYLFADLTWFINWGVNLYHNQVHYILARCYHCFQQLLLHLIVSLISLNVHQVKFIFIINLMMGYRYDI